MHQTFAVFDPFPSVLPLQEIASLDELATERFAVADVSPKSRPVVDEDDEDDAARNVTACLSYRLTMQRQCSKRPK